MIVKNINDFKSGTDFSSVIGIGKFDGFHIGHRKVIEHILKISKNMHCIPAVFTIKNYPSSSVLMDWGQKMEMLKKSGIRICLWADFNEIRFMSHSEFLEKLYFLCNFKYICIGSNFRFGYNRSGDIEYIRKWAKQKGISIRVVRPVTIGNRIVSSTMIKKLISKGDFIKAREMLGRWYGIGGVCIHGHEMGRNLGYPTINLELKNGNIPLSQGVYACVIRTRNKFDKGILFYGKSKIFDLPLSFEIHVLDKNIGNKYGHNFFVIPLKKIRGVRIFNSIDRLVERIKKDIIETRKIFNLFNLTELKKNSKM